MHTPRGVAVLLSLAVLASSTSTVGEAQAKTKTTTTKPTTPKPPASKPAAAPTTPNIIVLLIDDLGWQDLAVPFYRDTTDSNRKVRTPSVAKLAAQGVLFTDAYAAASVGGPSRVALLTGVAPATSRVTGEPRSGDTDSSAVFPLIGAPDWNVNGLTASSVPHAFTAAALPKLLRAAGYRSIHVGTTRWSADGVRASDPKSLGFDETYPGARRADSLAADALKALTTTRAASKPFFLWLSYDAVREDGASDDRAFDDAIARGLDSAEAHFASKVEGVDRSIGDILSWLDANALTERTMVVLLSDNGAPALRDRPGTRHFQNAPLRGGLGSAYEGGLRVPLIVRWPGTARVGFRSSSPVTTADVFATIVRAAKIPTATAILRPLIGVDLTSTLNDRTPVSYERPLLWHAPNVARAAGPGVEPFTAVRVGKWKLIHFYQGSRYELFDLSTDIGEGHDVSLRQPEVAARLSDVLRRMLTETNAQLPLDKAYGRAMSLPGRLLAPTPPL